MRLTKDDHCTLYYPRIAKEENGMGIDTETYIAEDGNIYNKLNNSGIGVSDAGNAPYEGIDEIGSSFDEASTNGMTVTQTYYNLKEAESYRSCFTDGVYYSLFYERSK